MKEVKKKTPAKKNAKKENNNKTKLFIIIGSVVLGLILIIGCILLFTKPKEGTVKVNGKTLKIQKTEAQKVEYDTYDNSLVSFKYPKGWKVEVAPFDYIHYSFKVYNPKDPNYEFIFMMKLEGFNKSEAARNWQKTYYPTALFAQLPVINPQTTTGFYNVWNEVASYVNKNDAKFEYLPLFNEFNVIDTLATNEIGGDILRATYKDANGKLVQGLFTAAVKSAGSYYVNSNVFNLMSSKIDVWPLMVYNTIIMTAPDEEFNNWQGILDKCLSTVQFSDTFIQGFNKEENQIMQTIQANQRIYDSISDMIMDSWEKRN